MFAHKRKREAEMVKLWKKTEKDGAVVWHFM